MKNLYLVPAEVTFEILVVADNEKIAAAIAEENMVQEVANLSDTEEPGEVTGTPTLVIKKDQIPQYWLEDHCIPYEDSKSATYTVIQDWLEELGLDE